MISNFSKVKKLLEKKGLNNVIMFKHDLYSNGKSLEKDFYISSFYLDYSNFYQVSFFKYSDSPAIIAETIFRKYKEEIINRMK